MDNLLILIADSNEDFLQALAHALTDRYQIHYCTYGRETLDCLRQTKPDILVLDLMLPEMDGFSILQACEGLHPKVLATTSIITPYIQETAEGLGIDYIMRKPCDIYSMVMRIDDLAKHRYDNDSDIPSILHSMSFSPKHNGTRCLLIAAELFSGNPEQLMTKELYPEVGKRCQPRISGKQVERDIRYAIGKAWDNGNEDAWRRYFPQGERPTNGELISRISEVLQKK